MFFRLIFLVMMIPGSAALAAPANPSPAQEHILLIAQPKVWSAPRQSAKTRTARLAPGARVRVTETKAAPGGGVSPAKTWYRVELDATRGWMPDAYLAPPPQKIEAGALKAIGAEPVDRFHGLPPEYQPPDLRPVGPLYDKEVKAKLRKEAAEALELMIAAARRDGIKLQVVSGYRPWSKQQELYENKVRKSGLEQNTVAKPGHSEHQLGAAVDLTDGNEATLLKESFGDTPAGKWLRDHAWTYGFAVSFTRHNQPETGIAPEPWHYRYWGISQARTQHFEHLGEVKTE